MSKASRHIQIVRPDLEDLQTSHVQARVIVGFCDDKGVPRDKDRFFIVEPRVGRQVLVGASTQDRALLHPGCKAWNLSPDGKTRTGRRSIRIRLQHIDVEDAYSVGCICYRAEGVRGAPKPPGKSPYCKSNDMVTASRWDGTGFADIPCAGQSCPLRQPYHQDSGGRQYRKVDAKTLFRLTGRIDEDDTPALLVSVVTGSDVNVAQFAGLLDGVGKQWADLCRAIGVDIPFPGYGLPIRLAVYESTGDASRFPRIHYTLDADIEELFQRELERRQRMSAYGSQLAAVSAHRQLPPASFSVDDDALDAQEVLAPMAGGDTQLESTPPPAHEPVAVDVTVEPAPAPAQASSSPFPPTLFERARRATMGQKAFTAILQDACANGAVDAEAVGELLRRCLARVAEAPASLSAITAIWAPFAQMIHETCPEYSEQLTQLGCPPAAPASAPVPEEDIPFGQVTPEASAPAQPLTLEAAVTELERHVASAPTADKLGVWNKHRQEILKLAGQLGSRVTPEQTSRIVACRPA